MLFRVSPSSVKVEAPANPSVGKAWLPGLILAGCLLCGTVSAQQDFKLLLQDGQIEMQADNADFRQLLQQLATEAGFKLWISQELQPQPVHSSPAARSLKETLDHLLQDYGHALVYGDDGEISALYVLPPGEDQPLAEAPVNKTHRLIEEMLASSAIPENIKAALMQQTISNNLAQQENLVQQSSQALTQIIEQLQRVGDANAETLQQLGEQLKQQQGPQ